MLETAHRCCIKYMYMQSLPSRTRTDVALSRMTFNPIITDIDYRKLVFLGQLSPVTIHCITKVTTASVRATPGGYFRCVWGHGQYLFLCKAHRPSIEIQASQIVGC